MKATLILTLMTMLVPPKAQTHNGETETAARDRYGVIADAIQDDDDDDLMTLLLVTTARHESAFVRSVHSGKRRGDKTKKAPKGRSWSIYQFMCGPRSSCKIPKTDYTAKDVVGVDLESTERASDAARIHLGFYIKRCAGQVWCIMRNYIGAPKGKLSKKNLKVVRARVATFYRLKAKVKKCRSKN